MVADCGATVAKYLLCVFNFIFFVIGASVLCVGVWLAADKNSFIQVTKLSTALLDDETKLVVKEFSEPDVIEQAAYVLIALGAFIFIISFLGYCGAIKVFIFHLFIHFFHF
ncbi:CD82 antigen [Eurytemora carolleeae]|uniref:CD82 antigen n=1 Tax=Eurytemora carolleeae TaxID=1294199 RepID=UPI000C7900EE|nr:CD82 antigen [Eurytemora carolleeae]|eukprot:XP_023342103.1 CD82 antigen-like [Eurytemora affinis]